MNLNNQIKSDRLEGSNMCYYSELFDIIKNAYDNRYSVDIEENRKIFNDIFKNGGFIDFAINNDLSYVHAMIYYIIDCSNSKNKERWLMSAYDNTKYTKLKENDLFIIIHKKLEEINYEFAYDMYELFSVNNEDQELLYFEYIRKYTTSHMICSNLKKKMPHLEILDGESYRNIRRMIFGKYNEMFLYLAFDTYNLHDVISKFIIKENIGIMCFKNIGLSFILDKNTSEKFKKYMRYAILKRKVSFKQQQERQERQPPKRQERQPPHAKDIVKKICYSSSASSASSEKQTVLTYDFKKFKIESTQRSYANEIKKIQKTLSENYIQENLSNILRVEDTISYADDIFKKIKNEIEIALVIGNEQLIEILLYYSTISIKTNYLIMSLSEKTQHGIFHIWKRIYKNKTENISQSNIHKLFIVREASRVECINAIKQKTKYPLYNCVDMIFEYLPYA
jgi:hypothetical protein